jgi:hypothetical protein
MPSDFSQKIVCKLLSNQMVVNLNLYKKQLINLEDNCNVFPVLNTNIY